MQRCVGIGIRPSPDAHGTLPQLTDIAHASVYHHARPPIARSMSAKLAAYERAAQQGAIGHHQPLRHALVSSRAVAYSAALTLLLSSRH